MVDVEKGAQTGLTVVIPAFNEERGIGPVLDGLSQELRYAVRDLPHEIIVVDDGSSDETAEVVRKSPSVRLIQHVENRGYGAALKTGIRHAQYDLVCITDADGTYPHEAIPGMVQRILRQEHDMVVAAREGARVATPWIRLPAKWAIGRLANLVVGQRIPDLNSGLRVFHRSTALQFFSLLPEGFSFTTTITLAMFTNGYLVDYVPIDYYARVGRSKIRPVRDTLNFIQLILSIALYFSPLKIFLPFSAFLMAIAIGWGVFTKLVTGMLADVSTLVIFMTAIQVAVVGLLAELINRRLPNYYKEE